MIGIGRRLGASELVRIHQIAMINSYGDDGNSR